MSGTLVTSIAGLALATAVLLPNQTLPESSQDDAWNAYARAFTLEHEERAYPQALKIYERLAGDERVDGELRSRARARARSVAEELASEDFAAIMPGNAIVYLELGHPGGQLRTLLDQLGLLGGFDRLLEEGAQSFAISPELIDGLVGVRGAAVAITGIPLGSGAPPGVFVLHPGNHGVARGLLETALPAGGVAVEPIDGQPTWRIEEQAYVTLTSRLLLASSNRQEIADVLRRIGGDRSDSLAESSSMQENLSLRGDDLMYLCINAEPVRPMLDGLLAMAAAGDPQIAAGAALLDVQSFQSLVMRAGVDEQGMTMDASLRLDEGHRSLAFNLLRPAPVDRELLRSIPRGTAAFLSASLNERGPAIGPLHTNSQDEPVVTSMDLGREVFANLVGTGLFVLPPDGSEQGPLPNVALVLSANDPTRSRAIWNLGLGLASLATGGVSMEPGEVEIAGHAAEKYVAQGVPIYLVEHETELLISPSTSTLARALKARDEGQSILEDEAFAGELARLEQGTTGVAMLHMGRLAQAASPFLPESQRAEMAPVMELMRNTSIAITNRHGANEMGFRMALRGLPDVGPMVAELLRREREGGGSKGVVMAQAVSSPPRMEAAAKAEDEASHGHAGGAQEEDLQARFDALAAQGDVAGALNLGERVLATMKDDPRGLNNFAWALLTEERYHARFDPLALQASLLSNQGTDYGVWQYVDTLALACFRKGDIESAIRLQERTLELVGEGPERADLEASLKRYREAQGDVVSR